MKLTARAERVVVYIGIVLLLFVLANSLLWWQHMVPGYNNGLFPTEIRVNCAKEGIVCTNR